MFVQFRPTGTGERERPGDRGRVKGRSAALLALLASLLATVALAAPLATASLIAPAAACPNQDTAGASARAQEQTMLCMTNFARAQAGEAGLEDAAPLDESARDKAADILACDSFSHYACGREFSYWIRASGYMSSQCWHVGENLAWGTNSYGSVRSIFRAWMRSPEHRANILGAYSEVGIDLQTGDLSGRPGTRVWAQHFGSHCEDQPAS
jgi:uncharacterized protein YkwD